ncbi:MAG TPA: hypothetical protein PKE69_17570, partial [Pyrinomonadaceae bacterium]|nr:hypothetical protein [Pyrinomonadaceae bacterium]
MELKLYFEADKIMIKRFFSVLLTVVIFLNYGISALAFERIQGAIKSNPLTIEKMIVADGSAVLDIKMSRLSESKSGILSFKAERESALTVIVANNQLRGPLPSSMKIVSENPFELPSKMGSSSNQLVLEVMPFGNHYELAIRDGNTG